MMAPRFRLSIATGGCLALAGLFSCAKTEPRYERAAADCAPAAWHAVHSQRLRGIMARMGGRTAKTWPQEIAEERAADAQRERESHFEEAWGLAAALGQAADQIPLAVAGVQLAEPDRAAFLAGATRLKAHAGELETAAIRRDFDRMDSALGSIRTTCNGCHAQFRELAGPIEVPPSGLWVEAR